MAKTKAERLQEVHKRALDRFDKIQVAMRDERLQCLSDRRFYSIAGAQWEGPLGEQWENKPRLEFNKVHLSVIRIINEWRNNRITVDFIPKDGTSGADLADTCNGLYRADEQDSGAQEAYDNAFEEAVGGGFGAFRLRAVYEDEDDDDNDEQTVVIEPIFDADSSVYFDLDAKRQDKADAKFCFVLSSLTREGFEDEFHHSPSTWPKLVHQREFDWSTPDIVYTAEYYEIEETKELIHIYQGLDGAEMSVPDAELQEDPDKADELQATGFREVRQKKAKRKRVHKYILSGLQVEEDCGLIAGKHIPIVPVYGKRWFVDNVERCMGHVRLAKDAQRLMNSLLSWLTELAARFDVEKPIMSPEQIMGHTKMWAEDNISRYPYLLANMVRDMEGNPIPGSNAPMGYTKAPNIPPAMSALIQIASQALDDLLGNQQAGEQLQPNQSGKAVELIQTRLDMQVFIYMSNMAKAMKRAGEIWLSMKKDVTPEQERQAKMIGEDGSLDTVTLKKPMIDPETGEQTTENDLDDANFDVWVDVGPSSQSRRAATVRGLTGMAQITQDPETLNVLISAAMMNMEGEGLGEVRDFFRARLVKMGVAKPTEQEQKDLEAQAQNQQPDPQAEYLKAAAEQATSDAALGRAKTVLTIADAGLKDAQRQKTLADIHGDIHGQAISAFNALHSAQPGADIPAIAQAPAVIPHMPNAPSPAPAAPKAAPKAPEAMTHEELMAELSGGGQ
jgi:Phage P22-like portal protein